MLSSEIGLDRMEKRANSPLCRASVVQVSCHKTLFMRATLLLVTALGGFLISEKDFAK